MEALIQSVRAEKLKLGTYVLEVHVLADGRPIIGGNSILAVLSSHGGLLGWTWPPKTFLFISPDGVEQRGLELAEFVRVLASHAADALAAHPSGTKDPLGRIALEICDAFAAIELSREVIGNASVH